MAADGLTLAFEDHQRAQDELVKARNQLASAIAAAAMSGRQGGSGAGTGPGVLARNPCSRRTSPGAGKQRAYVATTEQIWQLYDEFDERYRLAVLLGAFAGLRVAEVCGLRVADVNFLKREIHPTVQYPAEPLKTAMARETILIADTLVMRSRLRLRYGRGRRS